jgi:hypothetical protein
MAEAMKLRAEIGDGDDRLLLDTIEGETDVFSIMDRLSEMAIADKLLAERARERIARLDARADRARATLQRMLEALGISRLERSMATLSVADGPRAVVITNQAAIPDGFWRRSVDKTEIAKQLKAGSHVDGAELANGQPVLRIHSR